MELLILLVEKQGRLVTREEIIYRLWGDDVFVDTRHGINTAVHKLRTALRDDAEQPRILQTVFGKGYRLVSPLVIQPSDVDAARHRDKNPSVGHAATGADLAARNASSDRPMPFVPRWSAVRRPATYATVLWICTVTSSLILGSLFALNVGGFRDRLKTSGHATLFSNPPVKIRRSVAVVGFKNLSGRRDAVWLSTALAEMLTTELANGVDESYRRRDCWEQDGLSRSTSRRKWVPESGS
jgi:DNA-binding winged helix-turn-helix (wHTH) protein